jgi:hypothetical protein
VARYSDEFRIGVLALLQGAGHPHNEHAVSEVYEHLKNKGSNITRRTILRWASGENVSHVPMDKVQDIVVQQKEDMGEALRILFWKLYEHALGDETIDQLKGAQAYTAMGIVLDKYRLVQGLPTEVVQVIMPAVEALKRAGKDPVEVFKQIEQQANAIADGNSQYAQ